MVHSRQHLRPSDSDTIRHLDDRVRGEVWCTGREVCYHAHPILNAKKWFSRLRGLLGLRAQVLFAASGLRVSTQIIQHAPHRTVLKCKTTPPPQS
jgi:hypothetical protein